MGTGADALTGSKQSATTVMAVAARIHPAGWPPAAPGAGSLPPYGFAASAKAAAAAFTVASMSSSEWASETKAASNCEGGK